MSNFLTQRWLLNRRHFLRGLGATVALPGARRKMKDRQVPFLDRLKAALGITEE